MGVYTRFIRPGRIVEMSVIGFVLLMAAHLISARPWRNPTLAPLFTFSGEALALIIIGYGFVASVLPVWLLLAPRDYLSTFLKIGTIVAAGARHPARRMPDLQMPAVTDSSTAPARCSPGSLFPFLFITIACGAVSGFHALISSGTTPKMLENETQARLIGYGGMLMESLRRDHGDDRRLRARAGRLFRDEQPGRR